MWKNIIYQQQRGEIAIGSGGIFGNGLFSGRYYSVPNAHNDFILSWLGNAIGFVGLCIVLGALLALVIKTFATGARSEDLLGSYICAGIGGALMAQIAVNVGMNLRVLPVIGVTLPFYSAGGSSVLMLYICVGVTGAGFACYFMAMEATSPITASLVFFFKPALAPVLALVFLQEAIPVSMVVGVLFILAGSLVSLIPALSMIPAMALGKVWCWKQGRA